ncbi:hypothetical protein [Rhodococcus ruber]|uniref:hypothetical protein n=1 Tax=Rhodococcus ruber TaxID=1830 RepID=UPI000FEF71AB|nr:hypothetical protein [Rhodococcus ruber]RQM31917.1 hypothetical protein TN91_23435 [Rhodococcus ruber]
MGCGLGPRESKQLAAAGQKALPVGYTDQPEPVATVLLDKHCAGEPPTVTGPEPTTESRAHALFHSEFLTKD